MSKFNLVLGKLIYSFQTPMFLISIPWALEMGQFLFPPLDYLDNLGIWPRSLLGLVGLFLSPLLHGGFAHLTSNTFPFIFLFAAILYFYTRIAWRVFFFIYFMTNLAVWIMARPANHIGASGLVFGFSAFLFASGFFRRDFISLAISILVYFFYGSMWVGILPTNPYMSWEAHLSGAVAGAVAAWMYSDVRLDRGKGLNQQDPDQNLH